MMHEDGRIKLLRDICFIRCAEISAPFKIVLQLAFLKTFLQHFNRIVVVNTRKIGGENRFEFRNITF